MFSPVDARAAAWLRLAFAVAIPYFSWSIGLAPLGVVPDAFLPVYTGFVQTPWYSLVVVALCVLLAVGRASRPICLVLVGVLTPSAFLSRGHVSRLVILVALLAFLFVPSDRLRAPWRAQRRVMATAGPAWPIRVMQLELSLLYGLNALAKTTPAYLRGDVLEAMSIALPNFKVDMSGGTVDFGILTLPVVVAAAATVGTEYFLAVAFWFRRLKWVAALVGVIFHWLLTFVVLIHRLNLVTIFLYILFLLPLTRDPDGAAGRRMAVGARRA